MSFGFLNALMLLGLAGAALPVLVHLLSRRNYDVVSWGAMQFLELGRRTRRRIRLEELLLLLLRIGLICLLALALSRPWAKGGLFSTLARTTPRDVAVVIDGSYSMGWEGNPVTPHAAAIQRTHDLLESLQRNDTVTLLDARDRARMLTTLPTSDFAEIRGYLDAIPEPTGTSSMPSAGIKAVELLSQGQHLDRDLIFLSDAQSFAWSPETGSAWRQFDETMRQSSVRPRVWAMDMARHTDAAPTNFMVDRLRLSRGLTVPGFPLRIETTVRQTGGTSTERKVAFAVNGQRIAEKELTVSLPPDGEANLTFEHRFEKVGAYVLSVILEADNLPGDNRSDAAVLVESGIPVLLVDGQPARDPTRSETFFVSSALTPARSDAPWVMATVIEAGDFSEQTLEGQRAVFLSNVARLSEAQTGLLEAYVRAGGGLVVAPGDHIDPDYYNQSLHADGRGLLPAKLDVVRHERDHQLGDVNVIGDSLNPTWLARFRPENGVDFVEARFGQWWRMLPATAGAAEETGEPLIAARLDPGDPFLIARRFGQGTVLQLAAPLDGDWSTLPSKNDFVPFVHELVFHLAASKAERNVESGTPLVLEVPAGTDVDQCTFLTPDGRRLTPELMNAGAQSRVGLRETDLPGIYRFQTATDTVGNTEYFVVQSDRRESDLRPLTAQETAQLSEQDRIRFVDSLDDIVSGMADEQSPTEMWRILLFGVLGFLIAEVLLTRRLVQGGHEAIEETPSMES